MKIFNKALLFAYGVAFGIILAMIFEVYGHAENMRMGRRLVTFKHYIIVNDSLIEIKEKQP